MFEDRTHKRTFYSAPQSVTSFVAALLEPALTVACYLIVTVAHGEPILRSSLMLCLLVFALTFPGRNRFRDSGLLLISRSVLHQLRIGWDPEDTQRGLRDVAEHRGSGRAAKADVFTVGSKEVHHNHDAWIVDRSHTGKAAVELAGDVLA